MKQLSIAILKKEIHAGGGLEKYFKKIYEALLARGHKVTVLSRSKSETIPVVQVSRKIPISFADMLWFDFQVRRWLKEHPQDIVLGFDRHFLPLTHYRAGNGCHAAFLERRKKESSWLKRLFLTCNPLHLVTLLSEKKTCESSTTTIICNSELVRKEFLHFYPQASPEKFVVIHNGVEWGELEKVFQEGEKRVPSRILFVGHEWQRKGLDRLLKALSLVQSPFFLTALGKERAPGKFLDLVHQYGLEGRVELIPQPQNPLPFYQKATIMVIPSRYDPFANVTLEALAMGLFVITTEANGGSEVLTPDNGCVLREESSPEDFAAAIDFALLNLRDPATIRESVKMYDFPRKLQEYIELFEQG